MGFSTSRLLVFVVFMCVFGVVTFTALPVYAQSVTQDTGTESNNIDFDEIPDEYIEEARKVSNNCKINTIQNLYFDCECYSLRFLEERIEQGGVPSTASIEFSIRNECRDATNAAGQEYQLCLRNYNLMEPGTDPEKLCACYANTFVRMMDDIAPVLQSKTLVPLKSEAMLRCTNKDLANKLYGIRNYNR